MPAKKSAKKAVAKKVPAKKTIPKKSPAKKATKAPPAKKTAAKKKTPKKLPPSAEAISQAAYFIYRKRIELGLPGDHDTDWIEAVKSLS